MRSSLKILHWTSGNGSGLDKTAVALQQAERRAGLDSWIVNALDETKWTDEHLTDVDVHVSHVHFPDRVRPRLTKPAKVVWVGHGTPEYTFAMSVEAGLRGGYGFGDSFMLMQHWLKAADARVTFWPRHQAIYQTMVTKGTPIYCVPMGVDRTFWCPGESRGKWGGAPSLFTAENPHRGKWPLDLFLLWPWVAEELHEAALHASYVVQDQHRWWFPLVNANGAHFRSYLTATKWGHEDLRNALRSIDFFIGLVEYGDHNQLSLQAAATGAKTISYRGNVYADYWLTPGDQREMAKELLGILKGDTPPREKTPVADLSETVTAMRAIYEAIA